MSTVSSVEAGAGRFFASTTAFGTGSGGRTQECLLLTSVTAQGAFASARRAVRCAVHAFLLPRRRDEQRKVTMRSVDAVTEKERWEVSVHRERSAKAQTRGGRDGRSGDCLHRPQESLLVGKGLSETREARRVSHEKAGTHDDE